ncbi:hypothetical protein [Candidatus Nitrosocosmicus arcticus]|nr:hypothetical protein [Candidatus Nitrosocosmicus arcticus]
MSFTAINSKKCLIIIIGVPLFVKIGFYVTILLVMLIIVAFVPMDFSKIDSAFGQSGNTLGQEGVGNEASQSNSSSQYTNQKSMCVSGDSTSLSCNNLSSENTDGQSRDDEQGPLSIQGKIYQKFNTDTEDDDNYIATVSCDPGDTAISSNFKLDNLGSIPIRQLTNTLDLSSNQATLEIETLREDALITVYINCFDNP